MTDHHGISTAKAKETSKVDPEALSLQEYCEGPGFALTHRGLQERPSVEQLVEQWVQTEITCAWHQASIDATFKAVRQEVKRTS